MLRFPLPLLALSFAVAIVAATHSSHWTCDSRPGDVVIVDGIVELTTGEANETFYLDVRGDSDVHAYMETNGLWTAQGAGVHRGDVTDHNLQRADVCPAPLFPGGCSAEERCWDEGDWNYPDFQIW